MPGVIAKRNESFEKLMRRFKRAIEKDDILNTFSYDRILRVLKGGDE